MSSLSRRLRNLEARLTDTSGLVPHSQAWLDYWTAKVDRILSGADSDRIPLEVVDAIINVAPSNGNTPLLTHTVGRE